MRHRRRSGSAYAAPTGQRSRSPGRSGGGCPDALPAGRRLVHLGEQSAADCHVLFRVRGPGHRVHINASCLSCRNLWRALAQANAHEPRRTGQAQVLGGGSLPGGAMANHLTQPSDGTAPDSAHTAADSRADVALARSREVRARGKRQLQAARERVAGARGRPSTASDSSWQNARKRAAWTVDLAEQIQCAETGGNSGSSLPI